MVPELVPAAPLTAEWHAARRGGVTATDIVTILGLSSTDSVYSLFWRKMQQAPEQEDNDRLRLGRELEPLIAGRWCEQASEAYYGSPPGTPAALYRNSARPWQMATPDRIITGTGSQIVGVLECKSWADADRHSWDDGPPARVRAQVLWQMDVMDVAAGHVGVLFLPSGEFRSYVIEHAPHALGVEWLTTDGREPLCPACDDIKLMRAAGEEFMARLRLELSPPDPDSSAATLAAVRARFTRQPDKTAEIDADLYGSWVAAKVTAAHFEEQARGHEIAIREQAGEASVLTVDGQPVARRIISDAPVKAHKRHQDYLRRITTRGDDDA